MIFAFSDWQTTRDSLVRDVWIGDTRIARVRIVEERGGNGDPVKIFDLLVPGKNGALVRQDAAMEVPPYWTEPQTMEAAMRHALTALPSWFGGQLSMAARTPRAPMRQP